MYIIAHISDPHLSPGDKTGRLKNFRKILRDIKRRNCDHIFLTGDIVDKAVDSEFELAITELTKAGYYSSDKLSVIPGNHDIFGGPEKGKPFSFPYKCSQLDYNEKVNVFHKHFQSLFEGVTSGDSSPFPYLKILNDKAAVIGINSVAVWSKKKNPRSTNGDISDEQLKVLPELFTKADNRIVFVMIHHHLNKAGENSDGDKQHALWLISEAEVMKLHSKAKLLKLFKTHKTGLILHGHTHITNTYHRKGCLISNGSASVFPFTTDQRLKYNLIKLTETSGRSFTIDTIQL